MNKFTTLRANIALYLSVSLGFTVLLSGVLGLDATIFVKEYFGLFRSMETKGIEARMKSMMFLMYILFSPLLIIYFRSLKTRFGSNTRIFFVAILGGLAIGSMMFFLSFVHEWTPYQIEHSSRGRLLLYFKIVSSDILFAFFCPLLMWVSAVLFYLAYAGGTTLITRFKLLYMKG